MSNHLQQREYQFEYTTNTILERYDLVFFSSVDEDLILLDEEASHYLVVNSVGYKIWNLLESKKTVSQLVSGLMEIYKVDFDTCFNDIKAFIQQMVQHKLIKVCS
ncbi:PqqD family protein [Legionella pneumophila]|uniref:PqqD family protein n=1 Tax=Legionella pneumophila TaxID=446 RepID=A0AAP3MBX1_LEGPN|nr:PqqD family protein [Legionella pneumophila]MCZ4686202.1 PqqD family protein [Legionella pneumophila]MCZ4691486.1 PqqD family protein [Legionella pneumophila]MCZ4709614.1 PqqD family protein [Legionella pneumophila]MCZ4719713.1 PqqD family protein [Legionella pneumophila]RYW90273.1 PqqD family protein [Legionella pneumophila]